MKNEKIQQLLTEANNEFRVAMNELCRPAEDMVQMAVCLSAKNILENYLKAFLLFKDVDFHPGASVLQLLKKCKIIDNDFRNINLSPVICRAESGEVKEMYCLSNGRINKCIEAAREVREVVMSKIMDVKGMG